MTAIFKREFRSYFHTVLGWLFVAVTLFFLSLYFFVYNLLQGYPYFGYTIQSVIFLYVITIPILTMRIFAEEKKNKTDQMLYTAPVSVFKIVFGKYLALVAIFTIPTAIAALYPLLMLHYGSIPVAEAYVPLLGYYLYGLAAIAIGMFMSAVTENQIVSAVLSVVVLFVTYMMSGITSLIHVEFIADALGMLDMMSRFNDLLQSELSLVSVFYFLSVAALMIFLTVNLIRRRRKTYNSGKFRGSALNTILVILVIAAVIFANFGVYVIPAKYTKFDMTAGKLYGVTDDTKAILSGLTKDVTIYAIASKDKLDATLKRTLDAYDEYDHVKVEYRSSEEYPAFSAAYTDGELTEGSLIVVSDERSQVISYNDIYISEIDYSTYSQTVTGYDAEGLITSAIAFVTSDDLPVVYRITGHSNDDSAFGTSFVSSVKRENVDLQDVNLLTIDEIPDDVQCIFLIAASTDLSEYEAGLVKDYLARGGHAYITLTYTEKPLENLRSILSDYGINEERGLIIETDRQNYFQMQYCLLPTVKATDVSGDMEGQYVVSIAAEGILVNEDKKDSLNVQTIIETSEKAILKSDPAKAEALEKEEGDKEGQYALGVWITDNTAVGDGKNTKIAVFSSYGTTDDQIDQLVSGNNLKLFTKIVSNLVDHKETISIPAKKYNSDYITVPAADSVFFALMLIVVVPLILVITGIVVWAVRRKKK